MMWSGDQGAGNSGYRLGDGQGEVPDIGCLDEDQPPWLEHLERSLQELGRLGQVLYNVPECNEVILAFVFDGRHQEVATFGLQALVMAQLNRRLGDVEAQPSKPCIGERQQECTISAPDVKHTTAGRNAVADLLCDELARELLEKRVLFETIVVGIAVGFVAALLTQRIGPNEGVPTNGALDPGMATVV